MKRSFILCRLLAIILIAGLVTAPLAAPVAAWAGAPAPAMAMTSMSSMTGDMPCCPDKSGPADCDTCPLMVLCMSKVFQALPSSDIVAIVPTVVRFAIPASDSSAESLGHLPLPRPPQSLIRAA